MKQAKQRRQICVWRPETAECVVLDWPCRPFSPAFEEKKHGFFLFQIHGGVNKSWPDPATIALKKFPFARIRHATALDGSPPAPAPPIHELRAETTAAPSSRGTRTHTTLWDEVGGCSIFKISTDIAVPVRPRNCDNAAVKYVRTVKASSEVCGAESSG